MMAAGRRLIEADHYVRDGKWKTWGPMLLLGVELKGATLGLGGIWTHWQGNGAQSIGI